MTKQQIDHAVQLIRDFRDDMENTLHNRICNGELNDSYTNKALRLKIRHCNDVIFDYNLENGTELTCEHCGSDDELTEGLLLCPSCDRDRKNPEYD